MNPFSKAPAASTTQTTHNLIEEVKAEGGSGILQAGNVTYHVQKLNLSEPGMAIFETTSGLYVKISGDYTFTTISRNA